MKKNNGMRPHDIVILLKVIAKGEKPWLMKDLSSELKISASEVSESLHRSKLADLISSDKKKVMGLALLEFLQYGLKYVFPQHPGAIVRGIPTAWSAPPLSKKILSKDAIVWPYANGTVRGQAFEPLYPSVPMACLHDPALHELLALVDALRIGRTRERDMAIRELNRYILHGK